MALSFYSDLLLSGSLTFVICQPSRIRDKLIADQREVIEIIDRAFTRAGPLAHTDVDEACMIAMRDLAQRQAELIQQQVQLWDAIGVSSYEDISQEQYPKAVE